jgi:hypothetical protein
VENHNKTQSMYPVSKPRFEPATYRIYVKIVASSPACIEINLVIFKIKNTAIERNSKARFVRLKVKVIYVSGKHAYKKKLF